METYKGTPIEQVLAFWDAHQAKLEDAKRRKAESNRKAQAKYREAHREELKAQAAQYYEENRDKVITYNTERYAFKKMAAA